MTNGARSTQDSRLARLEAGFESVSSDLHTLVKAMDNFSQETRRGMHDIHDRIATMQKAPWSVLAAWAGVMITVGSLALYPLYEMARDTRAALIEHKSSEGHPKALVHVATLHGRLDRSEGDIKKLDETLQREMRLLDEQMRAQLGETVKGLIQRMGLVEKHLSERTGKRFTSEDHDRFMREHWWPLVESLRKKG